MKRIIICIVVIGFLLMSAGGVAGSMEKDGFLRIHLPRDITLTSSQLTLGQIGILRGEESVVVRAGEIGLGRISLPGQELVIDRTTILSRLACNDIAVSKVVFTGAEKIKVKLRQRSIEGEAFVESALSFLKGTINNTSICHVEAIRTPVDLILAEEYEDVELSARLIKSRVRNQAKVQVIAICDGQNSGVREVSFRFKYNSRRLVTKVDIAQGSVISPENVRIENSVSQWPESGDWAWAYGKVCRRFLPAETRIDRNMVEAVKPAVVVKRNEMVVVQISSPGIFLTTQGKALQNGVVGDLIKVSIRISNSARTVMARVRKDGTLEPVF